MLLNTISTSALPGAMPVAGSLLGLLAVMVWRVREARGAVSMKKIVLPPMGMATGMSMFAMPGFRIPWLWACAALSVGAVALAYPLVRTSRLEREGEVIMMRRSKAFLAVILALAAIRFLARGYLDGVLSARQTGAVMYLVAFGMILRWRAQMFLEYRQLTKQSHFVS